MNSRMAVRWAKGTSWREVISTPKDDRQVGGGTLEVIDYLQNDDRMFCRILFQQVLEVRGAGAQNHLVGLGVLALMISLHALQHATGNKGYLGHSRCLESICGDFLNIAVIVIGAIRRSRD